MESDSQRQTEDGTRTPSDAGMFGAAPRESEGGAAHNMEPDEVITLLVGHPFPNGEPMNPSSAAEIATLGHTADEVRLVLLANPNLNAGGIVRLFRQGRSVIEPILAQRRGIQARDEGSESEGAVEPPVTAPTVVDVGDEERTLGRDLLADMRREYRGDKTAGLLRKYGIPLTAAWFLKLKPDYPLETIVEGIEGRLRAWLELDDLELIQDVARKSITSSPNPDWFPLLDWRERFSELWERSFSTKQGWWREEDYVGRPYTEYDELRSPGRGKSPTCEDGAPAKVEDGDGCPAVERPDARG